MKQQAGIIAEHVHKSFGKEHVLKDVNLTIPPGRIFGVVGNNGSGKTVMYLRFYETGFRKYCRKWRAGRKGL